MGTTNRKRVIAIITVLVLLCSVPVLVLLFAPEWYLIVTRNLAMVIALLCLLGVLPVVVRMAEATRRLLRGEVQDSSEGKQPPLC